MGGDPAHRGHAVLEPGRKLVLGRQAIVDARQQKVAGQREPPAGAVVRIEAADHPAAAMDVDQAGRRSRDAGVIQAHAQRALRTRDRVVVHRPERRPVRVPEGLERGVHLRPGLDRRQGHARRPILHRGFIERQDLRHLRVQLRHRGPSLIVLARFTLARRSLRPSRLDSAKLANGKRGARSCLWWRKAGMTRFFGAAWLVANQRGRVALQWSPISRWVIAAGVAIWALGSAAPGFAQCFPIAGAEPSSSRRPLSRRRFLRGRSG